MRKTSKIILILLIAILLIGVIQNTVSASASSVVGGITVKEPDDESTKGISEMAGKVLGILQVVTAVLAVVLVGYFGFMFVLGSPDEKSDYQKKFIPLIVGVAVVFMAVSIGKMIFNVVGA